MATEDERREAAIHRVKAKRAFGQNCVVYVVVNAFLVGIWAVGERGYFWPIWVMLGWGVALVLHAYNVYGSRGITEEDVQKEMKRGGDIVE
jgi:hypothetical protein